MSRIFERFNPMSNCPICGTNRDEKTVLIPIVGSQRGNICEAGQFHLQCLLDNLVYARDRGIVVAVVAPENKEGK